MIELQNFILNLLLVLAVPAVVALTLGAWQFVKAKIAEVKAGMSLEHIQLLDSLVMMAVQAAEQSGLAGLIANEGAVKKAEAVRIVQDALRSRGWDTLADAVPEIAARIEAAILLQLHKPMIEDSGDVIINQPVTMTESTLSGGAQPTILRK